MPYSMQYSLTIEHSHWDTGFRASYIGTNTRQGDYGYNYNSPVPDSRLLSISHGPFRSIPPSTTSPTAPATSSTASPPRSSDGMAQGLQFQSSWVWARDIGDMERGQLLENPFDRAAGAKRRAGYPDAPLHDQLDLSAPMGQRTPFLSSANRS